MYNNPLGEYFARRVVYIRNAYAICNRFGHWDTADAFSGMRVWFKYGGSIKTVYFKYQVSMKQV